MPLSQPRREQSRFLCNDKVVRVSSKNYFVKRSISKKKSYERGISPVGSQSIEGLMRIEETKPVYQAVNKKMIQYERLKQVLESDYVRNLKNITQKYEVGKKLDYRIRFRDKQGFRTSEKQRRKIECSPDLPQFSKSRLATTTKPPIHLAMVNSPKSRIDYTPKNLKNLFGKPRRSRCYMSYLDRYPKQDFDSL
ncbi:unnamed protein product [Moneuplotes crassus]|uniref:Uncharacterized protein n=1 Tax=Euplotes crassus TaxID=5936 RepID=A0AAD2D400_EUPCR|nr:unnamed protein product [Moneuplotes crassus]